jgi:dTDP-glucose pyrophosphorylase/predicted transcriptional regulator
MHKWQNIIIREDDTMETAIKVLNKEALRIVLVVNKYDQLVGTVTDGDIRRGLIKQMQMNVVITKIMFKNPIVVSVKETKESILSLMNSLGLLQIPIIDSDRRVVGLEVLQKLIKKNKYDNPVFLLAGGLGKRLKPLTDSTPKPMLKVGTKPILENILNQFISVGFHNFYISTHYMAEKVQKYFGDGSNWGVSINYVHEEKPLGTAGGLGLLPNNLIDLPILIMNGDLLTKIDFIELLNFHLQEGGDATMCVREFDFQVPYGVVNLKDHRVTSIVEKPVHRFFVNAGIYILSQSMLNEIDGINYLDMPQLLEDKIKNLGQINMFPVHEYWLDVGQMDQFSQAQRDSFELFK